ncbi:MAG: XRE family transcriptional regulator, partial [Bacteroidia bacterium]|nr:XRE family transcriptional regulator [Bacteroidia bacterium]
ITKDEGIVYKRIYAKGNILELHSDNKTYSPYNVHAKDILEIWQFVCTLNISDKKDEELNLESIVNMLRSMRVEIEQLKRGK